MAFDYSNARFALKPSTVFNHQARGNEPSITREPLERAAESQARLFRAITRTSSEEIRDVQHDANPDGPYGYGGGLVVGHTALNNLVKKVAIACGSAARVAEISLGPKDPNRPRSRAQRSKQADAPLGRRPARASCKRLGYAKADSCPPPAASDCAACTMLPLTVQLMQ